MDTYLVYNPRFLNQTGHRSNRINKWVMGHRSMVCGSWVIGPWVIGPWLRVPITSVYHDGSMVCGISISFPYSKPLVTRNGLLITNIHGELKVRVLLNFVVNIPLSLGLFVALVNQTKQLGSADCCF